ncbi:MAG: hypothetical protein PUP93_07800 [Rhizonema sp. NSF051]|nr:hypothetical protein [Rhizonema sp. NSF051]
MDSKISSPDRQTNFAEAEADTLFTHYSQSASGTLSQTQTDTLVNGGVSLALANAQGTFNGDANYSSLFADSFGISSGGTTQVKSNSQTTVAATFSLAANQTFSFDFSGELALLVKEIEHSKRASNEAKSKTAFVVLDTTNANKPQVLDYFGISGELSSPKDINRFTISASDHVKIQNKNRPDIHGYHDIESFASNVSGTYRRTFDHSTNITLVEINDTSIALSGDPLIGTQNTRDSLTSGGNYGNFVVTKDDFKAGKYDIRNFEVGKDEVDFQGWGNIDASAWFQGHQPVDTDKGALLTVSPGKSLLFEGVHANQLNASDFHFQ